MTTAQDFLEVYFSHKSTHSLCGNAPRNDIPHSHVVIFLEMTYHTAEPAHSSSPVDELWWWGKISCRKTTIDRQQVGWASMLQHFKGSAQFSPSFQKLSISYGVINSLWSSDTIWWRISGSILAQVMACCLTAPSHYLSQYWFIISRVLCHSPIGYHTRNASNRYIWKSHMWSQSHVPQGTMN